MNKKVLITLITLISLIIVFVGLIVVWFVADDGHKHRSDYLLHDPRYWDTELVLLDIGSEVSLDSLAKLTFLMLNSEVKVVIINDPAISVDTYSGRLNTILAGRSNVFTSDLFHNHYLRGNGYEKVSYGRTDYGKSDLRHQYKLITDFQLTSKEHKTPHLAELAVNKYHPRYKHALENYDDNQVDFRFFGLIDPYKIFTPQDLIDKQCELINKIVIIGDVSAVRYYSPARYYYPEPDSKVPDQSSSTLLAHAVLSLMNLHLQELDIPWF
jgi:hypothetical protein